MSEITNLIDLMNEDAKNLFTAKGADLVKRLGTDGLKTIVLDVLSGRNIRDSTEMFTRRRLATLNAATIAMFLKGAQTQEDFIEQLPFIAERILEQKRLSKEEKLVALWALGLTGKAQQNVLRDNRKLLSEYRARYVATCEEIIRDSIDQFGELSGKVRLNGQEITTLSWTFLIYLLSMVGAQTLTLRGSEKSAYGKLFERLVLGSLLHILGFEYTGTNTPNKLTKVFWLSSADDSDREVDATALWQAGKGIRFDLGFIGRGNPEISLDKVSRFTRESGLGSSWYMSTIIIVDRVGKGSRIQELARAIDGDIVQMSLAYWPVEVAELLNRDLDDFDHPLLKMPRSEVRDYLAKRMDDVPFEAFLA